MGNTYDGVDEYAINLIRYKVQRLAGQSGFIRADIPDLEQHLIIDLLARLPRFDARRAKRETFITRVVDNCIATLIEGQKAGVRDYRKSAGSLDDGWDGTEDRAGETPAVLQSRAFLRQVASEARQDDDRRDLHVDLEGAIERLPSDLRALCEQLMTSSVSEVARETGRPRGTLYEAMKKVRDRFEKAGLAVYLDSPDRTQGAPVSNQGAEDDSARKGPRGPRRRR